jgi:hypothetical protein
VVHHLLVPQEQAWCKHTTTPCLLESIPSRTQIFDLTHYRLDGKLEY